MKFRLSETDGVTYSFWICDIEIPDDVGTEATRKNALNRLKLMLKRAEMKTSDLGIRYQLRKAK